MSARLLTFGYVTLGVLAAFAYVPTAAGSFEQNANLDAYYLTLSHAHVFWFFAVAGLACCAGATVIRLPMIAGNSAVGAVQLGASMKSRAPVVLPPTMLWVSAAALGLSVYGLGIGNVLFSEGYLSHTGPVIAVDIGSGLGPLGVLISANVLLGRRAPRWARGVALLLILAAMTIYLGQATRTLALCPVLIYAGGVIAGRWTKRTAIFVGILATLLAVSALGIPLYLRGREAIGVIPALRYIAASPSTFVQASLNPLPNLLLGVPLSLYVGEHAGSIPVSALWVSLNPLPGSMTGWPVLAPTLRYNIFEPYSALGELRNYGLPAFISYHFAVGASLEALERVSAKCSVRVSGLLQAAVLGVSGLMFIRSTQYNLRTETRVLYYIAVVVLVAWAIDKRWPVMRIVGRDSDLTRARLPAFAYLADARQAPPAHAVRAYTTGTDVSRSRRR